MLELPPDCHSQMQDWSPESVPQRSANLQVCHIWCEKNFSSTIYSDYNGDFPVMRQPLQTSISL